MRLKQLNIVLYHAQICCYMNENLSELKIIKMWAFLIVSTNLMK